MSNAIMTVFSGLTLGVQQDTERVVNNAIARFESEQINECFQNAKNQARIIIERSGGNFGEELLLRQDAQLKLACIQSQDNSAELLQRLETDIKRALNQEVKPKSTVSLASIGAQITDSDFEQIIDNSVILDQENVCRASVENIAELTIRDSQLFFGCPPELIASLDSACQAQVQVAQNLFENLQALRAEGADSDAIALAQDAWQRAVDAPATGCDGLLECAQRRGGIRIEQEAGLEGECNQAQAIAARIASEIETRATLSAEQEVSTGTSPITTFLIVIGAIVGAFLIGLFLWLIIRSVSKNRAKQQPSSPYETYAPSYRPTGSSFDASRQYQTF